MNSCVAADSASARAPDHATTAVRPGLRSAGMARWIRRCLGLALVVGLVGEASAAAKWLRLEGPDFVVMSDATERVVRDFARDYAAYREATQHFFARPGTTAPRSILVLFSSHREFSKYTREPDKNMRGRFFSFSTEVDGRAVTALARSDDWDNTIKTIREFETIWVMRSYGWSLPTWMSQGAGKVLSTVEIRDGKEIAVGGTTPSANAWGEGWMFPWDRFFEASRSSPEYKGDVRPGVYHAQAWGLMHWLLLRDDNGPGRFADLARRLASEDAKEAVAEVGGVKLDDLTNEVRRHITRGRPPILRFPFDAAAVTQSFVVTPLPDFERLATLTDIAASSGRENDADLLYFEARKLAPNDPVVLECGARWSIRRGEIETGIDRYREAIAAGSTNANAFVASAKWRLDRMSNGGDREGGGIEMVLEPARAEIRRALELDTGMGETYRLIGRVAYLEPEPNAAWLEPLTSRVGPDFWGGQARFYRALLLGRLGRVNEAIADLKVLTTESEASEGLVDRAERNIVRLHMAGIREQVDQAAKAGRYADGLALLDQWAAEAQPAAAELREVDRLRQSLRAAQAKLDQRIFDRSFREVNRLIKSKQWEAAIKRTQALLVADDADKRSADLQATFVKLANQVDGIATLQLMKAELRAGETAAAIARAEAYLERAPADDKSRPAIEAKLGEARAGGGAADDDSDDAPDDAS